MSRERETSQLRNLPPVHQLVEMVESMAESAGAPRSLIVEAVRIVIDEHREALRGGGEALAGDVQTALAERAVARLHESGKPPLRSIINATGIIIHTGLGRAPLAESAARALLDVAGRYAPVELEIDTGKRGKRNAIVSSLLCELTGAEAATVVNNNAAAMMIVLSTFASGRGVIVSRGELIEIGGSFRLPDVMKAGGAVLQEVGTTNRTRIADYERAIDDTTAAIMKVHPSNYRVEGFTEAVDVGSLVELGSANDLVVIDDIGSGALRPTDHVGLASDEPDASSSLAAGADLVLFSGDKLLGGPQAGIIVGKAALVERIDKNPMMRAMRLDKLILAALGATLQLHRDGETAGREVPVLAMARMPIETLRERAEAVARELGSIKAITAKVEDAEAYLGGGSLPTHQLPSVALTLRSSECTEEELAERLRIGEPGVIVRVAGGAVWLDLRTIMPDQDAQLIEAIRSAVLS